MPTLTCPGCAVAKTLLFRVVLPTNREGEAVNGTRCATCAGVL